MKKGSVIVLFLFAVSFAAAPPNNVGLQSDTVWVTGTASAYTRLFWQDDIAQKSIVIQLDDTSASGRASDSACVSVEMKQVFTDQYGNQNKYAYVFASEAQPDSSVYPGSLSFNLWDSLNITAMDTLALWAKQRVPIVKISDTIGWTYRNDLDTLVPGASRVAASYRALTPDFSPAVLFKLVGKANNKKASAVRAIIHYWQLMGSK